MFDKCFLIKYNKINAKKLYYWVKCVKYINSYVIILLDKNLSDSLHIKCCWRIYTPERKLVKSMRKKKELSNKFLAILLLPAGILLSFISSLSPMQVESIYSKFIFKPIGQALSTITGFIPFSAAEIIVIFLGVFAIFMLFSTIVRSYRQKRDRKSILLGFILNIVVFFSILYFAFNIIWGLNYYRQPFSVIAGLNVAPASIDELEDVCESIIEEANDLRNIVAEDENKVMYIKGGYKDIFNRAFKGYQKASEVYSELGGKYGNPKGVFFSEAMSYTGISGVYFPFTAEANVNTAIPHSMLPATACHEMAHQRGFAREDEANYIAYFTCRLHPDADFQYSGTLLALINSMNALYGHDRERYLRLRDKYSEGVRADLSYISSFWQKYEGPVEEISNKINDTYLKANRQKDGVYSYGRMVDLLIAERRLKGAK